MTQQKRVTGAQELFNHLRLKFGADSEKFIEEIIKTAGGLQIRIPDLKYHYRHERNQHIKNKFTGTNYEELAILYRVKPRQIRRIVYGK